MSYQLWQDMEEPKMNITKWKKPIYILHDSNYMFWKKQNYVDNKKISGCQGLGWSTGFLGQWKYSVRYYNDGYMSLYICPNHRVYNTKSEP